MSNFDLSNISLRNFFYSSVSQNAGFNPVPIALRPNGDDIVESVKTVDNKYFASIKRKVDILSLLVQQGLSQETIGRIERSIADIMASLETIKKVIKDRTLSQRPLPVRGSGALTEGTFKSGLRCPEVLISTESKMIVNPKFNSTDLLMMSENADKSGWDLTAKFTSVFNTGLALSTLAYLEHQPQIALVPTSDIVNIGINSHRLPL
ncbi:hypothetical protein PHYBLDRAFT_165973 [Phycomyces blakesleeanus NRRL 1555(-)]|uniref:Uncharacterized protein n=1 Tax=Phycomyces blakesleeanus (strain ATCC 8743b / DSM 1359 / FGSC 10004 / NBRC 33097 / NRRL 1555) TaxID=763407 RepID=A0A167NIJ0_PHYB8|nr:hypothetical protein PHYBLDRAFT_165973 [Phycomyces blakesleeanus NRRL 1555(-)]OAD75999.1 hypothetical protein PHYBLDRAFT_165973 [Phycomyces blakesleeanus NRRL 1555(-)]|eukprot:XP_018294039.1 hypothetical protein PHYBLDRAFT_165973 [Phycomyces blakesleeanus NRRL 1555(-)]